MEPVTAHGNKKKQRFRMRDGFLRFYYGVLMRNMREIEALSVEDAFDALRPMIDSFYGPGSEILRKECLVICGEMQRGRNLVGDRSEDS